MTSAANTELQPRRLHVVPGGTARDGSSDSDSGWGGVAGAAGFSD